MIYRSIQMMCPECGKPLRRYEDRDKWRCTTCGGALVGESELALAGVVTRESADRARPCPHCRGEMLPVVVAELVLDRCTTDSLIWFDRGELGKLRTAVAADWRAPLKGTMDYALFPSDPSFGES